MALFFASDIHFGHENLRKYYPETRGSFKDLAAVDAHIIKEWNAKIDYEDDVYILGDLGAPVDHLNRCLWQLNGKLRLITGNHDKKIWRSVQDRFEEIHFGYHEIWVKEQFVTMCHYPIWEWNAINRGSYHLHGHLHGRPHGIPGRILDVGIDNHNLKPFSWEEIVSFMDTREIRTHHVK